VFFPLKRIPPFKNILLNISTPSILKPRVKRGKTNANHLTVPALRAPDTGAAALPQVS